jgi:hypothetical protein
VPEIIRGGEAELGFHLPGACVKLMSARSRLHPEFEFVPHLRLSARNRSVKCANNCTSGIDEVLYLICAVYVGFLLKSGPAVCRGKCQLMTQSRHGKLLSALRIAIGQ